jgi:hypothetical protein
MVVLAAVQGVMFEVGEGRGGKQQPINISGAAKL